MPRTGNASAFRSSSACAGRRATPVLDAFDRGASRTTRRAELAAALDEIGHITRLRLVDRVDGAGAPVVAGQLSTHVLDTYHGQPARRSRSNCSSRTIRPGPGSPSQEPIATAAPTSRCCRTVRCGSGPTSCCSISETNFAARGASRRRARSLTWSGPVWHRGTGGDLSCSAGREPLELFDLSRQLTAAACPSIASCEPGCFCVSGTAQMAAAICGSGHFRTAVTRLWRHARTTSLELPARTPARLQHRLRNSLMLATQTLQSASPRDALRRGPLLVDHRPYVQRVQGNVGELVHRLEG